LGGYPSQGYFQQMTFNIKVHMWFGVSIHLARQCDFIKPYIGKT
jgi:hypothetical protein